MSAERRPSEWKRIELQLDTAQIVLVVASLVGLCAASFFLGRWVERDRWQDLSGKSGPRSTKIDQTDAAAGLSFFDTLGKSAAEPGRQAHPAPAPSAAPAPVPAAPAATAPATPASPPAGAGAFAIQVFAGDRAQAERVASSLTHKGYTARVVAGTGGSKTARVRVVGYKTRADADRAASRLRTEDKLQPWVVKAE